MGDRGNIVVKQSGSKAEIFLYTHWDGDDLPGILASALLRGKSVWDDASYLTRIIFCEMVANSDDIKGLMGYGISIEMEDNEHPLLVVDTEKKTVELQTEDRKLLQSKSFEEFTEFQGITFSDLEEYEEGNDDE